jgi:hypothetical protein
MEKNLIRSCRTIDSEEPTQRPTLQPSSARLLYSRKEAARQLSISVRSLDYLISGKAFHTRRLGRKILIPHSELVRFAGGSHFGPMSGSN